MVGACATCEGTGVLLGASVPRACTRCFDRDSEYAARPIRVSSLHLVHESALHLGLSCPSVDFTWKPYAERSEEQRADYDRLRASIEREGLQKPVIAWHRCVLIGMRRVEIARTLDIDEIMVIEIEEDVRGWTGVDVFERLPKLKIRFGEHPY